MWVQERVMGCLRAVRRSMSFAAAVTGVLCSLSIVAAHAQMGTVRVDATPGHAINSFNPDSALGSSLDVLSRTGIDKVFTPHIIQESLSAGWGTISYRNNSELRMAAWHWTENGTSVMIRRTRAATSPGSTELKEPTRYILSYGLPHRGFSTKATPSAGSKPPVIGRATHI